MNNCQYVLYGFGISMKSLAKYFFENKISFSIFDDSQDKINEIQNTGYKVCTTDEIKKMNSLILVISPGVSLDKPLLMWARQNQIPIHNDISLFFQLHHPEGWIGVTGTFGKSTCVSSVQYVCNQLGIEMQLGGNVGIPIFDLDPQKPAIIELSAQQLDLCQNLNLKIAMLLNLMPQHLDWYKNMKEYGQAKLRIFQGAEIGLCNLDLDTEAEYKSISITDPRANYSFVENIFYENNQEIQTFGTHLSEISILGAYSILREYGFSAQDSLTNLAKCKGLPHRQELICSDPLIINDSKSTNLTNSIYLIQKYIGKRVACILGGKDTNQDLNCLQHLPKTIRFLTTGSIGPTLNDNLQKFGFHSEYFPTIEEICKHIHGYEVILFSPGYPSTDQYKNFEHRGSTFTSQIKSYCASFNIKA